MRPAVIADSSAVLVCAECKSKVGKPTLHSRLNLHDLLRESFILSLMVPSTSHSTVTSVWLGLAIASSTGLRRERMKHRATQVQYVKSQEEHIFLTSVSP